MHFSSFDQSSDIESRLEWCVAIRSGSFVDRSLRIVADSVRDIYEAIRANTSINFSSCTRTVEQSDLA